VGGCLEVGHWQDGYSSGGEIGDEAIGQMIPMVRTSVGLGRRWVAAFECRITCLGGGGSAFGFGFGHAVMTLAGIMSVNWCRASRWLSWRGASGKAGEG
jgi:hypothetical protein